MKTAIVVLLAALPALAMADQGSTPRQRAPVPLRLHPGSLALLIEEVGGQHVTLVQAKVVAVLNPQALLVESASSFEPTPGFLDRVVVLVEGGTIRVDRSLLLRSTVRITGVARSVLGMQVSREVPWPPELTTDVVRRYEIRAAVLTSSVQTADGVQLVTPTLPDPDPVLESR